MALFWRIWTAVILVTLVVLTLFVGLAALQFDSINSGLVGERLAVLAGRTAAPFQAAARIGLPLSTVRNAEALLERARQTDDAILAIHVFDEAGRVVHSTDTTAPTMIPPQALAARQAAVGAPWHRETEAGFFSSIDIPAGAGATGEATAGGILIVYPGGGSVTQVRAMGAELALAAIAVMLAVAALSALLLRFGLGEQIKTFEAIDGAIADFERGAWRSAASATGEASPPDDGTGELRQLLDAAEARYRATGKALAGASAGASEDAPVTAPTGQIDRDGLRGRLILMLAAIVTASVLAVGFAAVSAFDRAIEPELANRSRLIGTIIRAEIQRALELGIPLDAVAGLDRYLTDSLEKFDEVDRITIATATDLTVAQVQRPSAPSLLARTGLGEAISVSRNVFRLPILEGNRLVGGITVEISPLFVQTRLRDVFLDVLVLGLIAVLVALELALAVTIISVAKPLDRVFRLLGEQRAGSFLHRIRHGGLSGLGRTAARLNDHAEDLAARAAAIPESLRSTIAANIPAGRPLRLRLSDFNDIRLALFLFALGTEIAAAFMPIFARAADRPAWLGPELAAAVPLIFYLGAIAALSPFGSTLVRRVGARRLFLYSAPGAALALVGLGLSDSLIAITIWRAVMAVFYAAACIAGQEYAIRAAGEKDRARAVGAFVAVIYGGLFCGSALGGLLAGRFGFETAFFTGAVLAAVSVALGAASMRGRVGDREDAVPEPGNDAAPQPSNPRAGLTGRYLALLLGIAVPMNVTKVIFIWYLTPLMLSDIGSGPAEIARVLILYSLAILLLGPTVARLADSQPGPVALVMAGSLCLTASLFSLTFISGFWAIAGAVAGVGVGQVLVQTPLYALALRITGGPGPGIDALRVLERVGAIIGLAASAILLSRIGAHASIQMLGFVVLSGVAVYAMVEFSGQSRRE